ncbi:hypothetical protein H6P81_004173 [Aristolochia fimbriata]|uniref:Transmembrane protein n=1 Tax=Aristolochia fimbriata TaxID=158543 RepID=A0AAV7FEN6_ARIFI|nr:hypothetical protein H6P81_004173 [Aristolochia fimbriata]
MFGGNAGPIGFMRQRYSNGYASSGDELEDGVLQRTPTSPAVPKPRTWTEAIENILWMASAVFIIYLGDRHSNLMHVLWLDDRIRRLPLYFGFVGIFLNIGIVIYTTLVTRDIKKVDEKWIPISPSLAPFVALVGFLSFFMFSFALWPIWSFLTLPLLVSLFMAFMVTSQYLLAGLGRIQIYTFRAD